MNRKKKKKKCFTIIEKMDNLHFIPNNILTNFFKELTKYKNDYQQCFNYLWELYYAYYCIYLSISIHMHGVTSQL